MAELSLEALAARLGGATPAKALWASLRQGVSPFMEPGRLGRSAFEALLGLDPGGVLAATFRPEAIEAIIPAGDANRGRSGLRETAPLVDLEGAVRAELGEGRGTTKLLMRLWDGLAVEAVLIPQVPGEAQHSPKKQYSTTMCISSQVGCAQGCRFCKTASMGMVRDLSADEILAQVVHGRRIAAQLGLPLVTNVVFMGMGEPLANTAGVLPAAAALADSERMAIAWRRICVSTVAPSPTHVRALSALKGQVAWSLHAADDALRRRLVPSAKHTVKELRDTFLEVLRQGEGGRPDRRLLVAAALLEGVNDSTAQAVELAELLRPLYEDDLVHVVVNLIPYNDIGHPDFRRPSDEAVKAFRDAMFEVLPSIFITIRHARGDNASAACGQLATQRAAQRMARVRELA